MKNILLIAALLLTSNTYADSRTPLHVGANFAGTVALYSFLNVMGNAGCGSSQRPCQSRKEMLILAVPAMLATGLLMEATQAQERRENLDGGDLAANALGVGLAVGCVFAFDL